MEYETLKRKLAELGTFTEKDLFCFETEFDTDWGSTIAVFVQYHYNLYGDSTDARVQGDILEFLAEPYKRHGRLFVRSYHAIRDAIVGIRNGSTVSDLADAQYVQDRADELATINAELARINPDLPPITQRDIPEVREFLALGKHRSHLWKDTACRLLLGNVDVALRKQWKVQSTIKARDLALREERGAEVLREITRIEAPAQPLRWGLAILRRCHKCDWNHKCHDVVTCLNGID